VSDSLFAAGMNHRSAPVELRELLALDAEALRDILGELLGRRQCREALLLATCNRVEIYGVAAVPGEARDAALRLLGRARGVALADLEPHLYTWTEADAVRHVFRVASSLDSLVVGEPQILGQVKDAFALAQSAEAVGPILHALMSQAFAVAKRVRAETEVGRHAVSVSFAGVELARKIFGTLEGRAVLLIGAGEMGELAAKHLMQQGTLPVYVANRTAGRAADLARALAGVAVPFEAVPRALETVDIVIACTAASEPVVRVAHVAPALSQRTRPLFFIDLGVPRNVEAAVNDLDNAFCYDIDDLRAVVDANLRERQYQAQRAEAVVEREVGRFLARRRDLEVVPTIVSLRDKLEVIRQREVERALARLPGASEETRRVIEAMSQAIVSKVLHAPIVKLRDSSRDGRGRRWRTLIAEVFGLRGDGGSAGADSGR
jgi:glutamyl-tRNA reductase